MVAASAAAVIAAVPVFSRLLGRFGPRLVVSTGFVLSAAAHLVEWRLSSTQPWVAVAIYLHVAGLGALLLSGFWSLISERFDPRGAGRASGGSRRRALGGCWAAPRRGRCFGMAARLGLIFLAAMHVGCRVRGAHRARAGAAVRRRRNAVGRCSRSGSSARRRISARSR
jgi:hypothetical protein